MKLTMIDADMFRVPTLSLLEQSRGADFFFSTQIEQSSQNCLATRVEQSIILQLSTQEQLKQYLTQIVNYPSTLTFYTNKEVPRMYQVYDANSIVFFYYNLKPLFLCILSQHEKNIFCFWILFEQKIDFTTSYSSLFSRVMGQLE